MLQLFIILALIISLFISNEALRIPVKFPDKIIGAYASWSQCDEKIIESVKQGANVVYWFAINLLTDSETGKTTISGGPDYNCVARVTKTIRELGYDVIHLISVGGWDAPHPSTDKTPEEVFHAWKNWNENTIANESLGFYGFDGVDWDLEGNDDFSSQYNIFTMECLNLMGKFSQLAKSNGYSVTMAPCESYLDPTQPSFDRYVNHTYPEWDELAPGFYYHGHNTYAYLLDKYDESIDINGEIVPTFDMIAIQLYEGYSHAYYNITVLKQPAADYLVKFVNHVTELGWDISFPTGIKHLTIPRSRLVIGLANGWASTSDRFLFLQPEDLHEAWNILTKANKQPKGFMFWDIADEGTIVNGKPFYLTRHLNKFMKIR